MNSESAVSSRGSIKIQLWFNRIKSVVFFSPCAIAVFMIVNQPVPQNRTRMNHCPIAALILTTLLAGVSLAAEVQRPESPATTGMAADPAACKNLSVDEFARMAADKQNVILDVRTAREFSAGHIPGAMNLDVNAPDFQKKAVALDKRRTYLVHCATGVRSVRACEKLNHLDFSSLYNLPGGFKAWVKAGKPVEK
jgi:phage shock protein E